MRITIEGFGRATTDLDDARVRALPRPGARTRAPADQVEGDELDAVAPTGPATKVLVLANETVTALELLAELDKIDADRKAEYLVHPANPVDTGRAEKSGAAFVRRTRRQGRRAQGAIGDYRPPHRVGRSHPAAVRAGAGSDSRRTGRNIPRGSARTSRPRCSAHERC